MIQGKLLLLQCTDKAQQIIDDPHAVNTCPLPNSLTVSSAVAADQSLRHSVINLESLVVVHELEPAMNLALYGVL